MKSKPVVIYGIHEITFYNPLNRKPFGSLKVLGDGTFEMAGEQIKLKGGSNKFDWAVEQGNIETSISLTTKEYPPFLMNLMLGKDPTIVAASATGTVSAITNVKGTSIVDATNGISVVAKTAGSEANLKFGKYILVATDADEVSIYSLSDIDFQNGVNAEFLDDSLEVVAAQAIVAGANAIASFGFTFTGVGVPDFTVGDSAMFEVLPPHDGATEVIVGGLNDVFPVFGCYIVTQKLADGSMFEIDAPNCSASGLNLGGAEKAFTETPITVSVAYDSALGGVCKIRTCKPAAV